MGFNRRVQYLCYIKWMFHILINLQFFLHFKAIQGLLKALKVHFLSNLFSFYLCLFKTYACNLLVLSTALTAALLERDRTVWF